MNQEELLSKKRALELYETGKIGQFEVGTTKGLQQIHQYLFQDVFNFAVQFRTVNLSNGNMRFAPILFLKQNLNMIDHLPETTYEEVITKYVEMNIAHPFREGNGRATRIWLDQILKKSLKQCVDWSKVDKSAYLSAMERSPINQLEIQELLRQSLTDKINDREVYMKGIQASYKYEDLSDYDIFQI